MVTTAGWVSAFIDRVEAGHEQLTDLDRLAGDGDFGDNLLAAVRRAKAAQSESTQPFRALTLAFMDAGGTSGPLLGMWFRAFSRTVSDPLAVEDVAKAASDGLLAIQQAAGARVGDNTMVDAMAPAVDALDGATGDVGDVLARVAEAAAAGAESTGALLGRKGRSSYVGDHALGVVDPGALAIAWFFEAAGSTSS